MPLIVHCRSVSAKGHHKAATTLKGRNFLIRWFYKYYWFFAYCCVFTEFSYIGLYVLAFVPKASLSVFGAFDVTLWHVVHYVCLPACICKQAVNLAQLWAAAYSMAEDDAATANKKQQI